jgi:cupin fold WbuC family metalloprotein
MSIKALNNPGGNVFTCTNEIIDNARILSKESNRKRIIIPVHRTQDAAVQRMLNVLQPDTYIRPHMHPLDHAVETILVLKGKICFYHFTDHGSLINQYLIKESDDIPLIDIEPGVWHSFTVLEPDTTLFECKKGPYDELNDKVFAEWAPEEGSAEAKSWFDRFLP